MAMIFRRDLYIFVRNLFGSFFYLFGILVTLSFAFVHCEQGTTCMQMPIHPSPTVSMSAYVRHGRWRTYKIPDFFKNVADETYTYL